MITAKAALNRLIDQNELFYDEMLSLMRQIMQGEISPVQSAAILMGLRVKGETVGEIAAAAAVMRELSAKVEVNDRRHLVDTCGTGGDGASTFNISTTVAFVAAAAGAKVAKHGNRSVSSSSGSADVLEALGVQLTLTPAQVASCIDEVGVGFMFAPNHHSAMRHVAPVRRELGVRTIFNILGPLTNPAEAENQVMGVFHPDLVGIQVRVLQQLGSRHVLIVHGHDGLDEITLSGPTQVAELKDGAITEYTIDPQQFGIKLCDLSALKARDVAESRAKIESVLDNEAGPCRDIVVLNAAAAIYAAGKAASLADGVLIAADAISSGAARAKLTALIAATRRFAEVA
ncbi:anthranilate phosphoribosyltransferase [Parachitinimonas caeni]|uniref:Anthranilate phosphoribosyltransferase n=1 Tax=Parachitinimonas caeni TaxID=3031301 RepID=A0ABT7E1G5_9NEIS|nr:anthranilate phosphoribosyltransferase [Parachitinimonas caeni]MDK2126157.1 anthranilate phosphoribosyltransferase [Parachitinimonas caeni]